MYFERCFFLVKKMHDVEFFVETLLFVHGCNKKQIKKTVYMVGYT